MIIKKPKFNTLSPLKKENWPFTVSEVTVVATIINDWHEQTQKLAFAICHNMQLYALSGLLESHGLPPLKTAGIWKQMANLQPFFKHCENEYQKIVKVSK